MSEPNHEPAESVEAPVDPNTQPLNLEVPQTDWVKKSADESGSETRSPRD